MLKIKWTLRQPEFKTDQYIPVPFHESFLLQGKDQEIEFFIKDETRAVIPNVQDREQIRFRLDAVMGNMRIIRPFFRNKNDILENTYLAAGFTQKQIKAMSQPLARSIYIFDLYDSPDSDKRKLLSRSFAKADDKGTYTPVLSGNTMVSNIPGIAFVQGNKLTSLSYLSLPAYFLSAQPQGMVYLQISFFNSIAGRRTALRQRQSVSMINEGNYIALAYNAQTRLYRLPPGAILDMEEMPVPKTSQQAEADRIKRNNNMEREFKQGTYRPATEELLPDLTKKFPPVSF